MTAEHSSSPTPALRNGPLMWPGRLSLDGYLLVAGPEISMFRCLYMKIERGDLDELEGNHRRRLRAANGQANASEGPDVLVEVFLIGVGVGVNIMAANARPEGW